VNLCTRLFVACGLLASVVAAAPGGQDPEAKPARYRSGPLPPLPALAAGGGEVFLEVEVTEEGTIGGIATLRATPSFTDQVVAAVRQWGFDPATKVERPDAPDLPPTVGPTTSTVLVVAVFRPPTILAPARGEPSRDLAPPSTAIPFPSLVQPPPWPPLARDGGLVLVEARVDGRGTVAAADVLDGMPGFHAAALETVRGWTFLPVRAPDVPEEAYVYILLGFPTPVIGGMP
jgi:outer membrane biosynthesis protein TonB